MTYPPGPYGYGYPPPPPPPKPGVIPLAPLRVSDLLGGVFSTYGRYWKPLLGITAIAYGTVAALLGGVALVAYGSVVDNVARLDDLPDDADPGFADFQPLIVTFGTAWLVMIIGMLVAGALVNATVHTVTQEAVLGRPALFGAVWRRAWSRVGAVIGSVFLSGLAAVLPMVLIAIGMVTLIGGLLAQDHGDSGSGVAIAGGVVMLLALASLPLAVWLWGKFLLAPAAAVIENQRPVAALRRSAHLVRGSWWRIAGCTLLMGLILGAVAGMVQQVISFATMIPFGSAIADDPHHPRHFFTAMWGVFLTVGLIQLVVQALMAPLQPLMTSLLYIDQRIRKENLAPALAESAGTPLA
ncbi:oxidoreductase [Streptomyces sp. NPDC048718]|uniref:oxidoreductase n=1 Tax=Streptomyces sp. NPDC048718 TaxID=3365587 RepID=UPI00371A2EB4